VRSSGRQPRGAQILLPGPRRSQGLLPVLRFISAKEWRGNKADPRSKTSAQETQGHCQRRSHDSTDARAWREIPACARRTPGSGSNCPLFYTFRGLGQRPHRFGFPILAQLFPLFEHVGLGIIEIGVNARALDGVTGSAAGHEIARILLSFASRGTTKSTRITNAFSKLARPSSRNTDSDDRRVPESSGLPAGSPASPQG